VVFFFGCFFVWVGVGFWVSSPLADGLQRASGRGSLFPRVGRNIDFFVSSSDEAAVALLFSRGVCPCLSYSKTALLSRSLSPVDS